MDVVPERIFEEILTSVLNERFPESHWATKESFVRCVESKGCVHHLINRTWKVYNISVVTRCLQVTFLKRLLIPSPCNNFGCLTPNIYSQRYFWHWVNKNLWKYIPNLKGLLCGMTLPSAVVPQKKEMEPNQNASQIARIHINITILGGMPANRRERRAPQK